MEGEVLRDDQWARIEPFVPGGCKGKRGPRSNGRLFVDALLWMARSGGRWRDLPERFGPYSDGKTQALERMMPDILAGFVEHAALISERRREDEERTRRNRDAEARRRREEAFNSREKRRMEFVDVVHEELAQRDKLTTVLIHLENATSEDAARVSVMTTWVRQRLKQIDALISPHFLDISARSSKVDFAEPDPEKEAESGSFYSPPINLQLWSVDDEKGLATSCSPLE